MLALFAGASSEGVRSCVARKVVFQHVLLYRQGLFMDRPMVTLYNDCPHEEQSRFDMHVRLDWVSVGKTHDLGVSQN